MLRRLLIASVTLLCACGPAKTGQCADPGTQQPDQGRYHIPYGSTGNYTQNPPSSGPHWPCWAPYQPATTVIPPEQWIHNLEHGGVVLLFQCPDATQCPDREQVMVDVDNAAPDAPTGGHRIVVTAYPNLPKTYAVVAWDWLALADPDPVDGGTALLESNFKCFIATHEGHGPEDIASGGSCP